jgi:hypothetical protein
VNKPRQNERRVNTGRMAENRVPERTAQKTQRTQQAKKSVKTQRTQTVKAAKGNSGKNENSRGNASRKN